MSSTKSGSILGTIASYSTSKVYGFAMRILTGFVRPLLLAPEMFGLWNLCALILQYVDYYLHLGAANATRFRLPYLWGRKEDEEAERVKGTFLIGSLVPHVVATVAFVLVALLGDWETHVRAGVFTLAAISLLAWYHRYLGHVLQGRQNFRPIIRANYIMASLAFFLGTTLIYLFGIYGIFATALIDEAVVVLYLRYHCRERTTEGFRGSLYLSLVRQGFPIMAFDMASNLVRSADRLLIAAFLGTEQLGFYALAAFIFTALLEIPGAAREVLEPRMMQEMSSLDPGEVLRDYFFRPLVNTAHYIPLLIGPAIFVLPFIDIVLPRYVAGVLPAQVLAVGGYFLAISFVVRGVVVANEWQVRALAPIVVTALVNIGLNITVMEMGYGIVGVAAASSFSFVLLLVLLLGLVKRRHPRRDVAWAPQLLSLVWPFLAMVVLVGGLLALADALALNRWVAVALQLFVFAPLWIGFIRLAHGYNSLVRPADLGSALRWVRGKRS